jgi:hypothetical protein
MPHFSQIARSAGVSVAVTLYLAPHPHLCVPVSHSTNSVMPGICVADGQFSSAATWWCPAHPDHRTSSARPARALPDVPLFLNGTLFHYRDIPVSLVSYHHPASSKARQNRSFCAALCQEHQTTTFLGTSPATACFADFAPGIKIGQCRPARCTTLAISKVACRPRLHQQTILELGNGQLGPAALIAALYPSDQRREHNTLCHRMSVCC